MSSPLRCIVSICEVLVILRCTSRSISGVTSVAVMWALGKRADNRCVRLPVPQPISRMRFGVVPFGSALSNSCATACCNVLCSPYCSAKRPKFVMILRACVSGIVKGCCL